MPTRLQTDSPKTKFVYVCMKIKSKEKETVSGSGKKSPQAGGTHFVSITELMLCTGLSRSSINRGIKAGKIPIVRIGNRILIPSSFLKNLEAVAEAATKEEKNENTL